MTLTDIYRGALEKLHVVAAGESAQAEDTQLVAAKYASLYDMLYTRRLVTWSAVDDVPDEAVIPVQSMLAYISAADFAVDPARFMQEGALDLRPIASVAESQLRRMVAKDFVYSPATPEYF